MFDNSLLLIFEAYELKCGVRWLKWCACRSINKSFSRGKRQWDKIICYTRLYMEDDHTKAFNSVGGYIGGEPDETIYILACLEALSIVIMACDIDAPKYIGPQLVAIE